MAQAEPVAPSFDLQIGITAALPSSRNSAVI
jgi:hypothetical protein